MLRKLTRFLADNEFSASLFTVFKVRNVFSGFLDECMRHAAHITDTSDIHSRDHVRGVVEDTNMYLLFEIPCCNRFGEF